MTPTIRMAAENVDDDLVAASKLPGVSKYLNGPLANNYVYVLVPKSVDVNKHLDQAATNTSHLNKADGELLRFGRSLIPLLEPYGVDAATQERLESLAFHWNEHFHAATNLIGCEYAIAFARELQPYVSFSDLLSNTSPNVLDLFRRVPLVVTDFLRINLHLPFSIVGAVLSELLDGGLASLEVDRLEMARWPNRMSRNVVPPFPTLIIYAGINSPRPNAEALSAILRTIHRVTMPLGELHASPEVLSEFALPWMPFASVSQGYKLWKRYLNVLNIVDEIYDPSTGMALVREDGHRDDSFANAVRSAVSLVGIDQTSESRHCG
jgi:hypothetical protein